MSAGDRMLWFKAWTETRWAFLFGIAYLLACVLALYVGFPDDYAQRFPNGAIAVSVEQVRALLHDGTTFIWLSWFGTSALLGLSILALALAGPGLVKSSSGAASPGTAYALSLPVSRRRLAGVRMAVGVVELAAAAILPSLLVCALAPLQGQSFPLTRGLVHALIATVGATALYGLFVFLSAAIGEPGKAVAGGAILFLYGMFTFLAGGVRRYSVFRLMTADTYFVAGEIPWLGILACLGLAAALVYASVIVVERRDF